MVGFQNVRGGGMGDEGWVLHLFGLVLHLDDTPMGGSPRPMEPMGPHRPRALKYTPTGGSSRPGSSRPGSLRPIGLGPSAMAHRPWPMEPLGPHMGPMGPPEKKRGDKTRVKIKK